MTHTRERENKKLFQSRDECDTRGRGTKRGELKFIEKKFSSRNLISFLPISQRVLLAMINYNSIQPQNHTARASNPSLLRVILIQDVSGLSSIIRPRPIVQRLDNAIRWMHRYPVDTQYVFLTVIRWIVIFSLDSVIHSLNDWAQIYNKGHSVSEFLFSPDNKASERDYNNFPSQSLYLTRYKNCPYRKDLMKEKSNPRKFKWRKGLDMISKLYSKNQRSKTKNYNKDNEYESDLRGNEVNLKHIDIYYCHIFTVIITYYKHEHSICLETALVL